MNKSASIRPNDLLAIIVVVFGGIGFILWGLGLSSIGNQTLRWLGSIIVGFFIVGTPVDQRNRRFDEQRVQELQMLQNQVLNYWTLKHNLPANLSLLQDDISGFVVPMDPDSKTPYEYKILDPLKFELCATFARSNNDLDSRFKTAPQYAMPNDSFQQNWNHETGRTCFTRTIDPELYKTPNNKI